MNSLIKLHTAIILNIHMNAPFNYSEQADCMSWQLGLLFFYYTTTSTSKLFAMQKYHYY